MARCSRVETATGDGSRLEGDVQGSVGDRHQEPRRHAVAAGVGDDDRHPAVGQAVKLVVVAADVVGGARGVGEAVARQVGARFRQQLALQLAGDLDLVAHQDAVDHLEGEQEQQQHDRDQEEEARSAEARWWSPSIQVSCGSTIPATAATMATPKSSRRRGESFSERLRKRSLAARK